MKISQNNLRIPYKTGLNCPVCGEALQVAAKVAVKQSEFEEVADLQNIEKLNLWFVTEVEALEIHHECPSSEKGKALRNVRFPVAPIGVEEDDA